LSVVLFTVSHKGVAFVTKNLSRDDASLKEGGAYLNFTGKMLIASLGAWLAGKYVNTKLKGTKEEMRAITEALLSSKRFQEELNKPNATVESIIEKMRSKEMSAATFKRVIGIKWPL